MLSCLASLFMAASLAQAPDQAAWLKSVPGDVAVVARTKALETARDDLMKMLEAMSGNAAALARPQIEQGLAMMEGQHGKESTRHPFLMLMSLPKDGPMPGWAVLVQSDKYEETLKGLTRKDDLKITPKDGVDSFDGPDGQPWYGAKGQGFVAFGPDQALIRGVGKPGASLDEKLTKEIKATFLGGDMGLYVNVAALQAQYADQIEQGKQMVFGMLDQAGAQMDAQARESAKVGYGLMFDSIKTGDALALSFDFAGSGLEIGAALTVKGDSDAAKRLKTATLGAADQFSKLPPDAIAYTYANVSPEAARSMAKFGLQFQPGGKPSPEMQKAIDLQAEAGTTESYGALTGIGGGLTNLSGVAIATPKDPQKAVEAAALTSQAMKGTNPAYKEITVTRDAETYKGFKFTKIRMVMDLEKMTGQNVPNGAETMKKLMGGDAFQSWVGTDGKTLLTVTAKDFNEAKTKIDAVLSGNGVGKTTAFETFRGRLPKDVSGLFIMNAQGMVRFLGQTIGATTGKEAAIPADMPKGPSYFGVAIVAQPSGYTLRFVVPSEIGPVIEKGMIPMMQAMTGQIQ